MTSVRRVVIGDADGGGSRVLRDGPPPQEVPQAGRGLTFFELWSTDPQDALRPWSDTGERPPTHGPADGGTKFRIVELMPDETRQGDPTEDLGAIGGRSVENPSDATFHRNDTVDYNVVLSGEMFAVTERGETRLGPGDVVVQRGTAHTWSNRSAGPCVYASVMVSARARGEATS